MTRRLLLHGGAADSPTLATVRDPRVRGEPLAPALPGALAAAQTPGIDWGGGIPSLHASAGGRASAARATRARHIERRLTYSQDGSPLTMIRFPTISRIDIDDYGMYPGDDTAPGLHAVSSQALTVVVGANGLGKTTLLLIAFRLLTGPFDIPGASGREQLGNARLEVNRLNSTQRREFDRRVAQSGSPARAAIAFALGEDRLEITRSLATLELLNWSLNGTDQGVDETRLHSALAEHCGVWSYADWILVLRFVTFYMDDRQVLFWDRSAQRQLLRSLFLPPEEAQEWVEKERDVLALDSRHRNLRNVLNQEAGRFAQRIDPSTQAHADLREELLELLAALDADRIELESLLSARSQLQEERADKNLERLRISQRVDKSVREYEHAKLALLASQFPSTAQSALFVWNRILADGTCLVCGNDAPHTRDAISSRIERNQCAVCASELTEAREAAEGIVDISLERSIRTWDEISNSRTQLEAVGDAHDRIRDELRSIDQLLAEAELRIAAGEARTAALQAQLPSDEQTYLQDRSVLASMRSGLDSLALELSVAAENFEAFVAQRANEILERAEAVKRHFDRYAELFLIETGELSWSPREERVGQSAHKVTFPAYELQLTLNGDGPATVRNGPDDVSESQKEFIDLAFRMALVEAASGGLGATIVIDTPESSLDSVFAERAAQVLADFVTQPGDNRLIVASNLTDSRLIPQLIHRVQVSGRDAALVDLFRVARPTAAIRTLGSAYRSAFERMLREVGDALPS